MYVHQRMYAHVVRLESAKLTQELETWIGHGEMDMDWSWRQRHGLDMERWTRIGHGEMDMDAKRNRKRHGSGMETDRDW